MKRKALVAMVFGAMLTMSLAGCNKENNNSVPASEAQTTQTAEEQKPQASEENNGAAPDKSISGSGKKLGVTINGLDAQAARKLFEGTQEKAKALGFEVMANNAGGTVGMADDVENFTEAGCDVIVLINADSSVVSNAVKAAADKGIYIISDESGYMDGVSTVIGMNNYAIGASMAMDVLAAINYTGKVVTTGHNDHPTIRGHYKTFDLVIQEYPSVEKVGTVYTSYPGTTEIAYNGLSALFAENPDIKGVLTSQDLEALGVIQATKEAGTYPNVKCTGIDGELDVLYDIKNDGCVVSTYMFDTDAISTMIVESAAKFVNGMDVAPYQEAPVAKVTKENVDEFIASAEAAIAK